MADAMTVPDHQRLDYPNFEWPTSAWWFTIVGVLIALVLLVYPGITNLSVISRVGASSALALAPAVLLGVRHFWRRDRVFVRRARDYGSLAESLDEANSKVDRSSVLVNKLVQDRQEKNALQIEYCYVFDGMPYIALRGKRGFRVDVGDTFTVVDLEVGQNLGTFEVTEVKGKLYMARSSGHVGPLWLAYMKKAGSARSEPPPGALAIRLPIEEKDDVRENT